MSDEPFQAIPLDLIAMTVDKKLLFVIGAPRSGTTWLQILLCQHSDIISSNETMLFKNYISLLDKQWNAEINSKSVRNIGITQIFSQDDFDESLRSFAFSVFKKIDGQRPNATLLLEKTPGHTRDAVLIGRLFPDAYFLHIIRDPRSVVCSLRGAAKTWGRNWAPAKVVNGVKMWSKFVADGRRVVEMTRRYKEVRYEDLLANGPNLLREIYHWLGIDADLDFCRHCVEICSIENMQKKSEKIRTPWSLSNEPNGFFRRGEPDAWTQELSKKQIRLIEYMAGSLLEECGYRPSMEPLKHKPLVLVFRAVIRKVFYWTAGILWKKFPVLAYHMRRSAEM